MNPELDRDSHVTHCCERHGCKYGRNEACTVAIGLREQEYACEFCKSSDLLKREIEELKEELEFSLKLESRVGKIVDSDW